MPDPRSCAPGRRDVPVGWSRGPAWGRLREGRSTFCSRETLGRRPLLSRGCACSVMSKFRCLQGQESCARSDRLEQPSRGAWETPCRQTTSPVGPPPSAGDAACLIWTGNESPSAGLNPAGGRFGPSLLSCLSSAARVGQPFQADCSALDESHVAGTLRQARKPDLLQPKYGPVRPNA